MLLWAALYADDTSPLIKLSNLLDFQKALDWAIKWADENGCAFHLEGDKRPVYLAYLKLGEPFPVEFDSLKLSSASIERKSKDTILGLFRKVRPISEISDKTVRGLKSFGSMIDNYGYECEWNIEKLKSIAYRLQRIKYQIVPEFIKKLVFAYFCGVVQFSSAIIWCRSLPTHRDTVRFYYSMAMSAILGLSAAEALNLSCCKNKSVKSGNKYYQRLLSETGLPSLEEISCRDAVSVTHQVSLIKPEWYRRGTSRQQTSARIRGESGLTTAVKSELKGTLISEIFLLKQKYSSDFLPYRQEVEDRKNEVRKKCQKMLDKRGSKKVYTQQYEQKVHIDRKRELAMCDTPCLTFYYDAIEHCSSSKTSTFNNNFKSKIDYMQLIRAYTLRSRFSFDCLDTIDRITNFKTPCKGLTTSIKPIPIPQVSPDQSSQAQHSSDNNNNNRHLLKKVTRSRP